MTDSEQELTHYLHLIQSTWDFILGGDIHLKPRLDANTVRMLQTRCLLFSSNDLAVVAAAMDNGVLFPNISSQSTRHEIQVRLERLRYMIPSLHTFLEDTKYLEPCAKIVKTLLPAKFKKSIREAFRQKHTGQSHFQIQSSEHTFSEHTRSVNQCIWLAYRQIWLFAMRHFPDLISVCPRKDDGRPKPAVHRPDENLWHTIANLASNCGFQTPAVEEYVRRNPFNKMASEFLRQCRPSEYYDFDTAALNTTVEMIVSTLQGIPARTVKPSVVSLSSDAPDNTDLADRCGRPFEQSFLKDKKHMFMPNVYNHPSDKLDLVQLIPLRECYLTSFKVKQDVFIAFFGRPDGSFYEDPPEDETMADVGTSTDQPQMSESLVPMEAQQPHSDSTPMTDAPVEVEEPEDRASPSNRPVTMIQPAFSQQQIFQRHSELIPHNQKTSDYIRSCKTSGTENPGTTIALIGTDTRQLTYCKNDYQSYLQWYGSMEGRVQCLAVDGAENIQNLNAAQAFNEVKNLELPVVLYEQTAHPASMQSRTLMDLDTPAYSRRESSSEESEL